MNISQRGIELIKEHEKCRLTAYLPIRNDVWTIGWGHTGPDVQKDSVWTQQQADDALAADLASSENCIAKHVSVPLTQFEYDALVSLVFNIGCGAFRTSTMLRLLNASDYDGASAQFERWNKRNHVELAELTHRRAEERQLFEATA